MRIGRKISGGKYHKRRKKRLHEKDSQERIVVLGDTKRKTVKVRGGNLKTFLLKDKFANIIVEGKAKKAEIKNVLETPQNRFLAKQNRLVKSAVIETSLGRARITNRPSQEGVVNAVLIEEKQADRKL